MAKEINEKLNIFKKIPSPWKERFTKIGEICSKQGIPACIVGGCVRDLLVGYQPKDWDIMMGGNLKPIVQEAAIKLSATRVVHHPQFLTYTLFFEDSTFLDIATARVETYQSPAALPVVQAASLEKDFARRDFTVNTLALSLTPNKEEELFDFFNGFTDIKEGVIRVLHEKSFYDDPTRIYRAARYAGRYNWRVEEKTYRQIKTAIQKKIPDLLSPVRRKNELKHILKEKKAGSILQILWEWGMWPFWDINWKWNSSAFDDIPKEEENNLYLFRLVLLLFHSKLSIDQIKNSLKQLNFSRLHQKEILTVFENIDLIHDKKNLDHPVLLTEFQKKCLCFIAEKNFSNSSFLDELEKKMPFINGEKLQELGYSPGPLYKQIIEKLFKIKESGLVQTEEDEIRYIIDNFPRKK